MKLPKYAAPAQYEPKDWELWIRLDSWSLPGLTDAEFRRLLRGLVKCECGLIMTGWRFQVHVCTHSGPTDAVEDTEIDSDTDTYKI